MEPYRAPSGRAPTRGLSLSSSRSLGLREKIFELRGLNETLLPIGKRRLLTGVLVVMVFVFLAEYVFRSSRASSKFVQRTRTQPWKRKFLFAGGVGRYGSTRYNIDGRSTVFGFFELFLLATSESLSHTHADEPSFARRPPRLLARRDPLLLGSQRE